MKKIMLLIISILLLSSCAHYNKIMANIDESNRKAYVDYYMTNPTAWKRDKGQVKGLSDNYFYHEYYINLLTN